MNMSEKEMTNLTTKEEADQLVSEIKELAAEQAAEENRDKDGFIRMKPKGGSKASKAIEYLSVVSTEKQARKLFEEVSNQLKNNQIKKAFKVMKDSTVAPVFIKKYDYVQDNPLGMKGEMIQNMNRTMELLLTICKTFYEYNDGKCPIADSDYDGAMVKYLANGNVEPAGIVPVKGVSKTPIKYPTLHNNMDKAYAVQDGDPIPEGVKEADTIESFLKRVWAACQLSASDEITLDISPKIDGVSINGTIEGTDLIDPQTRGDESNSIAVPGMARTVTDLSADVSFGIQYEAFITKENLEKATEYLGMASPYVSARNAVAGLIRRLSAGVDENIMKLIYLYPINLSGDDFKDSTYEEKMEFLQNYGIVPTDMIQRVEITGTIQKLIKQIREIFEKYGKLRESLSYMIDGIVITVCDNDYQDTLGRIGRTNKYQIALKFDPSTADAEFDHISLDNGRKGFRTIQLYLKHPVYLDGVEYTHIPVLSAELFEKMELREDSILTVHRVGDVIPSCTVRVAGTGKSVKLPDKCPSCGAALTVKNKKLFCDNTTCPGNVVGRILGFFDGIGLVGYSEAFVQQLYDQMNCKNLADVINLTAEDFKKKNITNKLAMDFHDSLIKAIQSKPDYVVLGSMGLPGIGPSRSQLILSEVNWKDILNVSFIKAEALFSTLGLGGSFYNSLMEFQSETFQKDLKTIHSYVTPTEDFNALSVVGHTGGSLSEETLKICDINKFQVTDGKSFDILIAADPEGQSGKLTQARKRNIPIYTEEEFKRIYQPSNIYLFTMENA